MTGGQDYLNRAIKSGRECGGSRRTGQFFGVCLVLCRRLAMYCVESELWTRERERLVILFLKFCDLWSIRVSVWMLRGGGQGKEVE